MREWERRVAVTTVAFATVLACISMAYVLFHIDNEIALTTMQNVAMAGLGYLAANIKRD